MHPNRSPSRVAQASACGYSQQVIVSAFSDSRPRQVASASACGFSQHAIVCIPSNVRPRTVEQTFSLLVFRSKYPSQPSQALLSATWMSFTLAGATRIKIPQPNCPQLLPSQQEFPYRSNFGVIMLLENYCQSSLGPFSCFKRFRGVRPPAARHFCFRSFVPVRSQRCLEEKQRAVGIQFVPSPESGIRVKACIVCKLHDSRSRSISTFSFIRLAATRP